MKESDVAYIAGLLDGEGSICLAYKHKRQPYRHPYIYIPSTTRALVELPNRLFGGCICTHKTYKTHHKQSWSWRLYGRAAIEFCRTVLPYLKVPEKIHRANMLVTVYPLVTLRNGKYSADAIRAKLQFERDFFHAQ